MKPNKFQLFVLTCFALCIVLINLTPSEFRPDVIYVGQFIVLFSALVRIKANRDLQIAMASILLADILYYILTYKLGLPADNHYAAILPSLLFGLSFLMFAKLLLNRNLAIAVNLSKKHLSAPALAFFVAIVVFYILAPGIQKFTQTGFSYSFISNLMSVFCALPLILISYLHLTNSTSIKNQVVLTSLFVLGMLDIGIQIEILRYGNLSFSFYDILWFASITLLSLFVNETSFDLQLTDKKSIVNLTKKVFFLAALAPMLVIAFVIQQNQEITPMYFIFSLVAVFIFGIFCISIIQLGIEKYNKELAIFQNNPTELSFNRILEYSPIEFRDSLYVICKSLLDKEINEIQDERKHLLEMTSFYKRMAHDIASPLSVLELVSNSAKDLDEERKKLLLYATRRVRVIANDILDRKTMSYAELNSTLPIIKDDEIHSLIKDLVLAKNIEIGRQAVTFTCNVSTHNWQVYASTSDLCRILSNLINNSAAVVNDNNGNILIHLDARAKSLRIEISDNGPGFPKEVLENKFSLPYTFGKIGGHGIGLFSANRTIQKWCGSIDLFNADGAHAAIELTYVVKAESLNDHSPMTVQSSDLML